MVKTMSDIETRISGEPEQQVTENDVFQANLHGVPVDVFLDETSKCSICGIRYLGYGHNAQPVNNGRCCDMCNTTHVITARLRQLGLSE
jgi:hypothetical protein